jgi:hypothetical protein
MFQRFSLYARALAATARIGKPSTARRGKGRARLLRQPCSEIASPRTQLPRRCLGSCSPTLSLASETSLADRSGRPDDVPGPRPNSSSVAGCMLCHALRRRNAQIACPSRARCGCPGPLILLGLDNPWANAEVDKYFLLKERSIFFLTKWKETPLNQKLLRCRGVRT